jgi:hypothetical protein
MTEKILKGSPMIGSNLGLHSSLPIRKRYVHKPRTRKLQRVLKRRSVLFPQKHANIACTGPLQGREISIDIKNKDIKRSRIIDEGIDECGL